jgi:hypothetical protein
MEAIRSSETSGTSLWTTLRHIPEDDTLHQWCCWMNRSRRQWIFPYEIKSKNQRNRHTKSMYESIYECIMYYVCMYVCIYRMYLPNLLTNQKQIISKQPRTKMFPALIRSAHWQPPSASLVHLHFTRKQHFLSEKPTIPSFIQPPPYPSSPLSLYRLYTYLHIHTWLWSRCVKAVYILKVWMYLYQVNHVGMSVSV